MLPKEELKNYGFTLIELLIVIAVIGVLAALLLFVIDPIERVRQSRDGGRKSAIAQLVNAVHNYRTVNGRFPAVPSVGSNWITDRLVSIGELKQPPPRIPLPSSFSSICPAGYYEENNYCYLVSTSPPGVYAVMLTRLEANTEQAKCTTAGEVPYFLWNANDNKTGVVCKNPTTGPWALNPLACPNPPSYCFLP